MSKAKRKVAIVNESASEGEARAGNARIRLTGRAYQAGSFDQDCILVAAVAAAPVTWCSAWKVDIRQRTGSTQLARFVFVCLCAQLTVLS